MNRSALPNLVKTIYRPIAARYLTELTVLAVILAVAAAGWIFIEIADEVREHEAQAVDRSILLWLRSGEQPRWRLELARDITALGGTAVLTLFVVTTAAFLALSRRFRACVFVVAAAGTGMLVSNALKATFNRVRPDLIPHDLYVTTASFPSGHALVSAVVYLTLGGLIAELVQQRWLKLYVIGVAAFLSFIVGVSRLYLGVHWPTDVLAGWTVGAGWAIGSWGVSRFVLPPRNPNVQARDLP